IGQEWQVEQMDVDPPKMGEVLVNWKYAGLCHSHEHFVTGDMGPTDEMLALMGATSGVFPVLGGPEGGGVVGDGGPGVTHVKPGDQVSASFIPSCGRCRYCLTGKSNLCDLGAGALGKTMITDGTSRHRLDGEDVTVMAKVGTFSEYTCVAEQSVIKVDDDL